MIHRLSLKAWHIRCYLDTIRWIPRLVTSHPPQGPITGCPSFWGRFIVKTGGPLPADL